MSQESQLRVPFYEKVENLLGRSLTPIEHEEFKVLISAYGAHQKGKRLEAEALVVAKNVKISSLGESLFSLIKSRKNPPPAEDVIKKLAAILYLYRYDNEVPVV